MGAAVSGDSRGVGFRWKYGELVGLGIVCCALVCIEEDLGFSVGGEI